MGGMHTILALAIAAWAAPSPDTVTLYSLGERRGEIKPCGCPRIQLGGLPRLFAFLDDRKHTAQQGTRFLVDSGNSFFSLPALPPTRQDSERAQAEFLAEAYRQLGVDVLVPGPRDLTLGVDTLVDLTRRAGVKSVAANLFKSRGELAFARETVVERAGARVGVTGIVDESAAWKDFLATDGVEQAKRALAHLRASKVDAAVLFLQNPDAAPAYAALGFDLVLLPPLPEGKSVAYATWDKKEKRLVGTQHVELTPDWEKPNRITKSYERFLAQAKDAVVHQAPRTTQAVSGAWVAQAHQCKNCHAKQYEFWKNTKHASAYLVLFAKNQHFDAECIGCHSVGFDDPRGFTDIASPLVKPEDPPRKAGENPFVETFMKEIFSGDPGKGPLDSRQDPVRFAKLKERYHASLDAWTRENPGAKVYMGVQCENCHGNRAGHPGPGFKKVGKVKSAACTACHHPPHDPAFNFAERKPKVACPTR